MKTVETRRPMITAAAAPALPLRLLSDLSSGKNRKDVTNPAATNERINPVMGIEIDREIMSSILPTQTPAIKEILKL